MFSTNDLLRIKNFFSDELLSLTFIKIADIFYNFCNENQFNLRADKILGVGYEGEHLRFYVSACNSDNTSNKFYIKFKISEKADFNPNNIDQYLNLAYATNKYFDENPELIKLKSKKVSTVPDKQSNETIKQAANSSISYEHSDNVKNRTANPPFGKITADNTSEINNAFYSSKLKSLFTNSIDTSKSFENYEQNIACCENAYEKITLIFDELFKNIFDERQYAIIKGRHLSDEVRILSDLGNEFGVTRERIRQIEKRCLGQIRNKIKSKKYLFEKFYNDLFQILETSNFDVFLFLLHIKITHASLLYLISLLWFNENMIKKIDSVADVYKNSLLTNNTVSIYDHQKQNAIYVFDCIDKVNARYGRNMIARILKGTNDKKILYYGLNEIESFGALSNFSINEIIKFIDYLISKEYIKSTNTEYPTLFLTDKAHIVLNK